MPRQVVVLGATGSIGVSTLDVIAQHPDRFQLFAMTAGRQVQKALQQVLQFRPRYVAVLTADDAAWLSTALRDAKCNTEVLYGASAFAELASHVDADIVMAAIVGAAGLLPTLAAVRAGKTVLLANKEALVMSGELFIQAVQQHGARLLPIDSEHNAIFQCLPSQDQVHSYQTQLGRSGIAKILLTGSGGPFRTRALDDFATITPAQAVAHPNWSMGQKISVDSATMMNKGLEFIETRWLFNCQPADIDVVIHPQSVIHSMVQYTDGSVLAQLGNPDMRTPIAHAMAFPERISSGVKPLNFFELANFTFEAPCPQRYPCLFLAQQACAAGQGATTALNAGNEVAVNLFLQEKIGFSAIAALNQDVLARFSQHQAKSLDDILALDTESRAFATARAAKYLC
jgi:1-deoxy-D-xylulose-5-phosphate reductoisomerase